MAGQGFRQRSVVVTGGARRLGAVIARHLAMAGHRVIVHHHSSEGEAIALAASLRAAGQEAHIVEQDLAAADAATALMTAARAAFGGPVTAIVNNASLFAHDYPPIASSAMIERHMAVNLTAPALLASAMASQDDLDDGAVVNILDQKIVNLNPDFFSYTCSKLALAGATQMLAQALGPRIAVNAVAPGLTLPSLDQTEAEFQAVARINLLERPVDRGEVARAVGFLLGAHGIAGQTIFVDNGQRLMPRARDVMFSTREGNANG